MRFIILFIFITTSSFAQKDSCLSAPMVGVHLGFNLPYADLQKQFGANLSMGCNFSYKTNKNWIYGIDFSYLYGKNVKIDVVKNLKTADGFVIDNAGNPADLRITERGISLQLQAGRVFKILNPNKNSGLMLKLGGGFLQHKVNLYDAQKKIAAIRGDLIKGYDHLSFGLAASQFIGYLYLSQNQFSNFYFGIECVEAQTKSLRKLNYDTGTYDTTQKLDILTGFRFGWILPLYKRTPKEFYYD